MVHAVLCGENFTWRRGAVRLALWRQGIDAVAPCTWRCGAKALMLWRHGAVPLALRHHLPGAGAPLTGAAAPSLWSFWRLCPVASSAWRCGELLELLTP
ncbi:hypothetical protein TorRG33x02_118280, partial [Trema orientale]